MLVSHSHSFSLWSVLGSHVVTLWIKNILEDRHSLRTASWFGDLSALPGKVKAGEWCWTHCEKVLPPCLTFTDTHKKKPWTRDRRWCANWMCRFKTDTVWVHMQMHAHSQNTQTSCTLILTRTTACAHLMPASLLSPSLSICPWTGKSPNYTHMQTRIHIYADAYTQPFSSSWLSMFGCQLFVRVFGRSEGAADKERCEKNHEKKVDFQVMLKGRQAFWLIVIPTWTVSSSTPHSCAAGELFWKMMLDSLLQTNTPIWRTVPPAWEWPFSKHGCCSDLPL